MKSHMSDPYGSREPRRKAVPAVRRHLYIVSGGLALTLIAHLAGWRFG